VEFGLKVVYTSLADSLSTTICLTPMIKPTRFVSFWSIVSVTLLACGCSEDHRFPGVWKEPPGLYAAQQRALSDTSLWRWWPSDNYTGLIDSLALTDSSGEYGDPIGLLLRHFPGESVDSNFTIHLTFLTPVVEVGESPLYVYSVQTGVDPVRYFHERTGLVSDVSVSGDTVDFWHNISGALISNPHHWLILPPRSILAPLQDLSCQVDLHYPGIDSVVSFSGRRGKPGAVDPEAYYCWLGYRLREGTYNVSGGTTRFVYDFETTELENVSYRTIDTILGDMRRADTTQLRVVRTLPTAERLSTLSERVASSLSDVTASLFARALVEDRRGLGLMVSPVAETLAPDGSAYFLVGLMNMGLPTAVRNSPSNWQVGGEGTSAREKEDSTTSSDRIEDWFVLPHRSFFGQLVNARCPTLPNREGLAPECSGEPLAPGEYVIPIRYQRTIYDESGRPMSVDLRDTVRYVVRY